MCNFSNNFRGYSQFPWRNSAVQCDETVHSIQLPCLVISLHVGYVQNVLYNKAITCLY